MTNRGEAAPRRRYFVAFFALAFLWLISWYSPVSVLVDPYQTRIPTVIGGIVVGTVTILHIWVGLPVIRILPHMKSNGLTAIGSALFAFASPFFTLVFAGAVMFRIVPLVIAAFAGSAMSVERDIINIRHGQMCLFETHQCRFGRAAREHEYLVISRHPDAFSRVIVDDGYFGFIVDPNTDWPQRARFEGTGTMWGMHIREARNLDFVLSPPAD